MVQNLVGFGEKASVGDGRGFVSGEIKGLR